MCGIAGIFDPHKINKNDVHLVGKMNDIQKHRGPDDDGIFHDDVCCLGHRRLAIIDLSKNGHQPFVSEDGRYQLVYNGEIYNYIELREELSQLGRKFKTATDTEVLLSTYLQYGEDCLHKFNGMFAFAVYDTKAKSLFLARDRFGIKPLYYAKVNSKFYFASEIKALRAVLPQKVTVNNQAIFDYLVFNRTDIYDETFLLEIKRLPKGHYMICDSDGAAVVPWWRAQDYLEKEAHDKNLDVICSTIDNIMASSVNLRLRSDVKVGSCLSGGLDSSILTGILFDHHNVKEKYATFSATFPGHPIDEGRYIDSLNRKYTFENFRTFPTSETAHEELKKFVYINDEPTTHPSFYSQYEVMRLARENGVVVLLDGQGGDENFAGYQYFHGFYLNGLINEKRIGRFISEFSKTFFRAQDKSAYQILIFQRLPESKRKQLLLKMHPYINKDFFHQHVDNSRIFKEFFDAKDLNSSLMRHFQYKLEHLLRMEDRNSMAFSLEARVPYLDNRLVEYVLSISEDYKIKNGETKYLQKQALGKYTIEEILNRKDKIGFGTPVTDWMQTPPWRRNTQEASLFCHDAFPKVFTSDLKGLKSNDKVHDWKINQLAAWRQLI